jgi:hypothetical protein
VAIPAGHFLSNEIDGNALILIMELGNVGGSEINNVLFMVSTTLLLFFVLVCASWSNGVPGVLWSSS